MTNSFWAHFSQNYTFKQLVHRDRSVFCFFYLRRLQIKHTHKNKGRGLQRRVPGWGCGLEPHAVKLDALMSCSHLTGHAEAAGIGATQAAGGRQGLLQVDRQGQRTDGTISAQTPSLHPHSRQSWARAIPPISIWQIKVSESRFKTVDFWAPKLRTPALIHL